MEERRRSLRTELQAELLMRRLDRDEDGERVEIAVCDVSKTGIGFFCEKELQKARCMSAF